VDEKYTGIQHYGCLVCLVHFGPHIIKRAIIPRLKEIAEINEKKANNLMESPKNRHASAKCTEILMVKEILK
jgi:hypothetical protein